MEATEQAGEFINNVLEEWTPLVISTLHRAIADRKLLLTEDLYRSLRWELIKATTSNIAQARLYFKLHGRWRDMGTVRSYRQAPVNVILENFVEKLGAGKFKYTPGYTRMSTDSKALRRIAWGISKGLLKRKQTAARKWYSKNFYSSLNTLIDALLGKYQIVTTEAIKNSLKDGE